MIDIWQSSSTRASGYDERESRFSVIRPQSVLHRKLTSNPSPSPDRQALLPQVIPLEELKRPRVDVVVNCSGVFRDLFVNQV